MNELEFAEMVDELARDFLEDEPSDWMEVFDAALTEREAELATIEMRRRGLPISVGCIDPLLGAERVRWSGGPHTHVADEV